MARPIPVLSAVVLVLVLIAACGRNDAAPAGTAQEGPAVGSGIGADPQPQAPAAGSVDEQQPAPAAPYPAAAPAGGPSTGGPATPATVLASEETNWPGVVAEVTEFRRKGNTLTAKVRLRNGGADGVRTEVKFDEVYLMDAANARKYEVLRDEKGTYIASLRSGWNDRWYDTLDASGQYLLWMKFPAPPAEVRAITLQLPGAPPFEDLAIQDG